MVTVRLIAFPTRMAVAVVVVAVARLAVVAVVAVELLLQAIHKRA
jgi:hypothetical protein